MRTPPNRSTRIAHAGLLAFALAAGLSAPARAQNLLRNGSFEKFDFNHLSLDVSELLNGRKTVIGFDAIALAPWSIPAGDDVELYFPKFPSGANSIGRVPHCHNVIGLDTQNPLFGQIAQSFSTAYLPSQIGTYVFFADIAGDRAKPHTASSQASIGTQLKLGTSPPSSKWAYTPWPTTPLANTTANSVFYPRALPYTLFTSGTLAGTFQMWDNTDQGVLVDAAHLFPLYFDDTGCDVSYGRGLAGFSILEDSLDGAPWSATTSANPWHDLKYSTSSGCSCDTDNDHITMHSGCNGGSTMLVAAWDQYSGSGARTTLHFTIEANAVGSSYKPQFTVMFYDWVNLRWVAPSSTGSLQMVNPPFAGGLLGGTPVCRTVDFDGFAPKYLTVPLSNFVSTAANGNFGPWGLVLAKVQFSNGCGASICNTTWPPAPIQPWTIDVHYLNIDSH